MPRPISTLHYASVEKKILEKKGFGQNVEAEDCVGDMGGDKSALLEVLIGRYEKIILRKTCGHK